MGLPNVTDNYKGYEEAELLRVADQLRDKQYLLVKAPSDNRTFNHSLTQSQQRAHRQPFSSVVSRKSITPLSHFAPQVHGTSDVHLQQSMLLARALTNNGVLFKQQIYPDEGHQLGGVKRHLFRSMTQFLEECFKKQVNESTSLL